MLSSPHGIVVVCNMSVLCNCRNAELDHVAMDAMVLAREAREVLHHLIGIDTSACLICT